MLRLMRNKSSKRAESKSSHRGRGAYTSPILVGLTPEQHEIVKSAATRDHRSVGEWARLVLTYQAELIEARAKAMEGESQTHGAVSR